MYCLVLLRYQDVLLGRGGKSNHHPGNDRYRRLIQSNKPLYRSSPKHSKLLISKEVVRSVLEEGGRFLEKSAKDGMWYSVSYMRAVKKASVCLRERGVAKAVEGKSKSVGPTKAPKRTSKDIPIGVQVKKAQGISNGFADDLMILDDSQPPFVLPPLESSETLLLTEPTLSIGITSVMDVIPLPPPKRMSVSSSEYDSSDSGSSEDNEVATPSMCRMKSEVSGWLQSFWPLPLEGSSSSATHKVISITDRDHARLPSRYTSSEEARDLPHTPPLALEPNVSTATLMKLLPAPSQHLEGITSFFDPSTTNSDEKSESESESVIDESSPRPENVPSCASSDDATAPTVVGNTIVPSGSADHCVDGAEL